MNNKTKELFCSISRLPVSKKYIDLRDIEINNSTDLVKIAYTFRNPIYETFRIIYMCDNKIVGYESTTSRMPNLCNIFNYKTNDMNSQNFTRGCVEMVNRMFRLGANGYYLMHNHPSGNAKASQPDIQLTKQLDKSVNGFLGHIIIDHGTFSWIDIQNGKLSICDNIPITTGIKITVNKEGKNNPIMDYRINSRNDLARLMYDVKHSENYSMLILCNCNNKIRLIQEVPNCFMNMSYEQLGGYIKNQALMTGSTKAYITTTSKNVFLRACDLKHNGFITDCIAYNTVEDKIKLLAKDDTDITQDILEKVKIKTIVTDKETIYAENADNTTENNIFNDMTSKFILEKN